MSVMTNLKWQHFDIKAKLIMSRTQIGVMTAIHTQTAWRRINFASPAARGPRPDAHTHASHLRRQEIETRALSAGVLKCVPLLHRIII
jgi:hypothetical protein